MHDTGEDTAPTASSAPTASAVATSAAVPERAPANRAPAAGRPRPADLLALALDVAHEAGDLLLRGRSGDVVAETTKTSPTDVVTALDRASEELVASRLREARPGDGLLGEEGADDPGTSGVRWIVDPLDGTVNFLYNLPNWAVSIAAEVDGQVVAGVVHAPALGVTYTAALGDGSARNGVPLSGSAVTDLAHALVATGFGYTVQRRIAQVTVLTRVVPRVRDIRRMGAASLDLGAAAAGLVDAYYERGLHPWDHAAGALVATEAGLRVGGLHGRPISNDLVIAAPPALFDALHDLLATDPPADRD
ncbi:Inositol-phosphate phosphatase [Candidatus Protofrankia datiscae]|uniref:Inositol-1-monophosphatase n=1 Tax=Candidatus Protofrankia datiscae TaxID=2716812 RepID=F8B6F5_9ACTN|nr:Inositol-phosphate phosphatase [Candidatus Protofrankia datiscae]